VGLSKVKAYERTPSFVKSKKGENKVNVGSSTKTPMVPRKNKRREKVHEPIVESPKHIEFHSSFESNGDVHSLIIYLNGLRRRKGNK
jgi:hypothetical protein